MVEEQHGNGPVHFSTMLGGGGLLEVYPAKGDHLGGKVMFGLAVKNVDDFRGAWLAAGGSTKSPSSSILVDPEGNMLLLSDQSIGAD